MLLPRGWPSFSGEHGVGCAEVRAEKLFMEILYPCARGAGGDAASSPSRARRWIPSVEHASSSGATRPHMQRAPQWVHALIFHLLMADARLPAVHEAPPLEGEGNYPLFVG